MNIVITGGAGFLGSLLTQALLRTYPEKIKRITLIDRVKLNDEALFDSRIHSVIADITEPTQVATLIHSDISHVFHLAAIVSSHAEEDFDLGMQVNLNATHLLLEQCRRINPNIRFIFASSLAVFGGQLPSVISPMTATQPSSSYGTQKAICELLVNDYARKGFVDALTVRLPTICIRPGSPNKAASSFVSGIIREPLKGEPSNCPVDLDLPLWVSSPDTVINNIIHASQLNKSHVQGFKVFNLPGIKVTPRQMLAALDQEIAGSRSTLVSHNHDSKIAQIVANWPQAFDNSKELELGFYVDVNFNAILKAYLKHYPVV